MSDTENALTPRALAVALLSEECARIRNRIEEHKTYARDTGALFHSRIIVFLEQTLVEVKRAAVYLENTDMSEEPTP
jgi:hypothetical protein